MASLASDGIPMAESSVEETRGINVAEGIDELENTRVSDIFDEGKDVNCERYLLESGENYSKPLEEHEQKNGLKDVDLKETYREEEDIKSNSLNVFDDVINSKDISNGETTDIHFENGEVSQHLGEKRDENEQEDSLDNEKALKMPQNEHRNEPDESDARSMQDLVSENSSKEFISEDCCEDDHLYQSDKIEERSEIEDVKVIESMEGKGTVQVEDNAMGLLIQDYEIEPPAAVKHIEPEEIVDPKSLESKVSETQIAIKEYVFQSEPETKSSPMQTDTPSFETKSNENDEEKIHVDTEASHEFSSTLGMASLASDGIPMAESSVEETRGINVAEGIDKLENTRVSDIFDEGKDVNCERSLMESGENYSKPLEEHEQKNGVKDMDLKETSREEEGIKSNSLNVFDDVINSKDIPNGETTDINFENGEVSQHVGEKRDENEQEDSLDNEEALKMPQNEHRNEPDESDSRSMQDLVPENSSKEFISEDCCEDDHLHQSDKIEERGKIEDVKAIESMEGKGAVQVEDNAMGLAIQDYEIEPPAVVKHLEPEEIVDPKSLESTVSETQNAIKEYVFQSEPETKSSPMQTDTSSFETKSNEYDEEKIHVDTEASLEFSSTLVSESSFLEPEEIVDNKSSEGTVSETQNAIEKDIFHHEPESKSSPMQTDTPRFETKSNEYDGEKIHVDTEAGLEFSSLLESESCSLEPEEIVDQKSLESTASETQNAVEEDIFHHEPESNSLQMQTDTPSYELKSNEYDGEKIHVDTEASLESSSMLESESFSVELEEIVDQKSLQITALEPQNVVEEDIFHCEPETKSLVMQTDSSSFETKSNEFDAKKIHVDTDASLVFSSMLESESSSPFRYVEDSNSGTFLTHKGQDSQDLQTTEGDNEALTLLREKASLAFDGIPMAESSVEETRGINVAEGIDKLENTRVSDIFDEGKAVNCERSLMESGENYSKPLEEHEQKNGLKDVDLKETSREEEGIKSNSLNVFDDVINSKDIPNGETTDINFENGEVSQHVGEKRDENEQEDSLDNEEALKMPQNEHRNEPDESDSRSMQDLVPENSSKEFISEDCCEDDHLHQSDKIEDRGEIEDVQVIESTEGKGTVQVEDNAMGLAIQDYEIEPPAAVKHLEPEEIVDPKSLESTVSETQNAIKEYVFQSEPETKSLPMQTDTPSFETKSNEYDEEKIHVDTEASLDFSSTLVTESSFLEPEEIVDNKSSEGTVSETQNAIEKDIFHHEPESKSSLMQTETPRFETKSNEYDGEKIHVDTEAGLEFSSLLESESCSLEPEEIVDQKSLEITASESQNAVEEDIFHHEPQSKSLQMQPDTPSYEAKSNEYDGEKIHVDTEASLESSSMLESESFSVELEEIVDQKSLQITASETQNVVEEDIFHCEPETKSLVMQTDTSSVETKSNEFDAEKIHVDTDASLVFSSMLESESSSPFRYVEDSNSGTFLTHRGQESQDLQAIEGDNEALTLLREKALKIDATERASVWGCCGFWNWLHAHGD